MDSSRKPTLEQATKQAKKPTATASLLLSGQHLEALVLERLEVPEEVAEFGQFEELSKLYSIEAPWIGRTQAELQFEVFDGRRLRHSAGSPEECDDDDVDNEDNDNINRGQLDNEDNDDQVAELDEHYRVSRLADIGDGAHRREPGASRGLRLGLAGPRRKASVVARAGSGNSLTWCRLLWSSGRAGGGGGRATGGHTGSGLCCLRPSETMDELGLVSASSSVDQALDKADKAPIMCSGAAAVAPGTPMSLIETLKLALMPDPSDDHEQIELKNEALSVVSCILASSTIMASNHYHQAIASTPQTASDLLMQGGEPAGAAGGQVSVCLLDKRHLPRTVSLGTQALQGRRWARASARLVELSRKLRQSSCIANKSGWMSYFTRLSAGKHNNRLAMEHRTVESLSHQVSHKFWLDLMKDLAKQKEHVASHHRHRHPSSATRNQPIKLTRKQQKIELTLHKDTTNELIELVKGSLNQLIDAQLLLRNKLGPGSVLNNSSNQSGANGPSATSAAAFAHLRPSDYEQLMRNNFNLLRIWQNLEETKRLVCFVCEPIKANLADLFWFNNHRPDYAPAQAFDDQLSSIASAGNGSLDCMLRQRLANNKRHNAASMQQDGFVTSAGKCPMFVSPLVNLDAAQVKRGLLQILEALNFLHVICKLVHRNLNPRNILISNNDNWKLSGLEFAIRFESTTISESASIIAQETATAIPILRYGLSSSSTGNAASISPLRRQRTLHQTKCQEFVRRHKCLLLQPDLDYLAPEIWRKSKCSHKSDIFSFGLIVGQTYDLFQHKPPINCQLNVQNYDSEVKKLAERRKKKLARLVPFEMRQSVLEMLELEPNLRPSASHILQLFRRPIELCKVNGDSLKHLRTSLGYLDTRLPLFSCSTGVGASANNGLFAPVTNQQQQQQQQPNSGITNHNLAANQQQHYHNATNRDQTTTTTMSQSPPSPGASVCNISQLAAGANCNGPSLINNQPLARRTTCNYFKRVTSSSNQREPQRRRQTRNLRLLNLYLRALDFVSSGSNTEQPEVGQLSSVVGQNAALASVGGQSNGGGNVSASVNQQLVQQLGLRFNQNTQQPNANVAGVAAMGPPMIRRPSFNQLRHQFEQTLEALKQVYKSSSCGAIGLNLSLELSATPGSESITSAMSSLGAGNPIRCAIDSRVLMFIVALHQRLLDQVALMRLELPPILGAGAHLHHHPSDRNHWPSANHRMLAEAEEQFQQLVSKHSLARLAESLADPWLKLDEFLLVFELVNDLLAFVGQKCRLNFVQRGKQLLNELTPIIGCASLSSSDDDDDDDLSVSMSTGGQKHSGAGSGFANTSAALMVGGSGVGGAHSGRLNSLASISQQAINSPGVATTTTTNNINNKMNNHHRHSDYDGYDPFSGRQTTTVISNSRQPSTWHMNLPPPPTAINITAPSPMGSQRDVNRSQGELSTGSGGNAATTTTPFQPHSPISPSSSMIRLNNQSVPSHHHQRFSVGNVGAMTSSSSSSTTRQQQHRNIYTNRTNDEQLADLASHKLQLVDNNNEQLFGAGGDSNYNNNNNYDDDDDDGDDNEDGKQHYHHKHDDKSRSQLIDELLKTINDESFNEFIDFNNNKTAAAASASASSNEALSAVELANSNRPKSAMDSSQCASSGARSSQSRPRTLNLNEQQQQQQQPGNRFDNVIRRMSTNFVQNFNKMSASTLSTLGADTTNNYNSNNPTIIGVDQQSQSSALGLRREKSSTSAYGGSGATGYASNSLHVDNQIPARRHSDNTINVPRIQVALSSPQASNSRTNLTNCGTTGIQRASISASKLANKWKLSAKSNQREASDKLSPNLGGALSYMRRHSSGNASGGGGGSSGNQSNNNHSSNHSSHSNNEQNQSNGNVSNLLLNASPFKTKSSSNLGIDFLLSNRSMKRRYSAASMLGHQTQRKAENLLDAGMKSVQNMFG